MIINFLRQAIPNRHPIRLAWHKSKAFVAAALYGFPARKLTVIGITGTDGKTTTVGMVAHILQAAAKNGVKPRGGHATLRGRSQGIGKIGALSTTFFRVADHTEQNATQKTSPSPFEIQCFLHACSKEGCTHVVLEYSSHGLVQGRTNYTWPAVAALTNTSAEHLDYHENLEQYRKDKGILFAMLGGKGVKVLNEEDESFEMYKNIPSQQTIRYQTSDIRQQIELKISGSFNVENALCAIACATAVGVSHESAVQALKTFEGIPGRLEQVVEGQPFDVFIDFTVTPVAYRKTLTALREMLPPGRRLLVLTGSCGDRMPQKRPVVGKICSQIADVVVVSNEDPYTEDPEKIIEEVWVGIDHAKTDAHRIPDRKQAIKFLFEYASEGDTVLLAGKGSDTTMWVKSGRIPWNERAIAQELLKKAVPQKHRETAIA